MSDAEQRLDAELAEIRAQVGGKRVVFVSGNWNIVHPGHLRLLRFASECGDALVVGVMPDGNPGAHVPADLRLESVRSIEFVDHAVMLPGRPEAMISRLQPAIVVKGKEHEGQPNAEQAAVEAYGGRLLFGSGEVRFSSLDLIRREFEEEGGHGRIVTPTDFPERHGFTMADLKQVLARFRDMKVVVVGDLIVDEYVDCEPLGMSQEDPTLVVSPVQDSRFIGGAAIVAAHARGLGADATFFSVAGGDEAAHYAREQLAAYGVKAQIIEDDSRPTTLKQRFRAEGKTLLRVSRLRQHEIADAHCEALVGQVSEALADCDLLIFSDFNYGCLPARVVEPIGRAAARSGVPAVADSQSSSQIGDISRFQDMLLLAPTEREARLAMRDFSSGLVVLTEARRATARAENVRVTRGGEGRRVHAGKPGPGGWATDRIPAMTHTPRDAAGAGDSMLTTSAMALVAGAGLWQSAYLGSVAAACQVGRLGNKPLSPADIEYEIGP